MDRTFELISAFFVEHTLFTVAELQKETGLSYKEAREGLATLEEKGVVVRAGGMSFRFVEKESTEKADTQEEILSQKKLDAIVCAMNREPLIKRIIAHCVEKGPQQGETTCIELQVRFSLSRGRAYGLLDQMSDLGIFSEEGRFQLSEGECDALLGKDTTKEIQDRVAERRRAMMRRLEETFRDRDEEDEDKEDRVDEAAVEAAKQRLFERLEAHRRLIEEENEKHAEEQKRTNATPIENKKEEKRATQVDLWELLGLAKKREEDAKNGKEATTAEGEKKTPKRKKKKK